MASCEEIDEERLQSVAGKIRATGYESGLIKDRRYKLKKYKRVFVGGELIDWLIAQQEVKTREEALALGKAMLKKDLFHHVHAEHDFKDEMLYYRFRADDPNVGEGPSAKNAAECATLSGMLLKKGQMKFNERFVVLRADEKKLYYYTTQMDVSPRNVLDLNFGKIDVNECGECKKGSYCFTIGCNGSLHTFCASHSKDQEAWIAALINAGATFVEDASVASISAQSIFDFTCLDIDKQPVNLNTFAGKVCLVVNTASY
jgi:hypothetical protein